MKAAKSQTRKPGKTPKHPERSQALEELEYREQRYRSIAESTPDGMVTIDADGNIVLWNRAAEKIFGYTAEEMLGKPLTRIMPKRFHEAHKNSLNRVASGGKPRIIGKAVEVIGLRKGKSEFPLELSMAKWKTGEGVFFTAVIRDITERKQAEEILRESQNKFQALVETTNDFIWEMDSHGIFTYCSPQIEKLWGFKPEEMLGKTPFDRVPPEDREQAIKAFSALMESSSPFIKMEMRSFDTTGRVKFLEIGGVPLFDIEGKLCGYRGITRDITERKQAEETLKDSEEKFRSLVESTSDWIWEINRNGVYTYASPKIKELLGYEPEEVIGKTPFDLMPAEEANRVASKFKDIIKNSKPIERLENISLHKDGHPVILETSGVPIFNSKGQLRGYRGIDRDITERKQAEAALREGEERFQLAIAATKDGIWEWDIQSGREYFSPRWCEIIGYSFDDPELPHTYNSWASRIHPDDLDSVSRALKNHLEKGARYDLDYRHRHKSGEYRWQNSRGQAIFDKGGKPVKMAGCISDITERKQAEEELNFRAQLLGAATDSIFVHDFEGKIIYANEVAYKSRGYTREEFMKMNIRELAVPEYAASIEPKLSDFLEAGNAVFEFAHFRKDKSIMPVEIHSQIIESGGRKLVLGIARDITDRKKMLDSLTITDRLAALGNMAGGFAHELNNPLTGVIGYAQLLLDRKDLSEDVRRDLTGIYEEAQRAAEVIKNFMVFALKRPLQKQLSDINSFIKDVLKLRQHEQGNNNIKVKTNLDPQLPLVMAGPSRMRQVFLDIITNAEYFMFQAHKKGTLTITTESKGDVIRASFADDGPGIPPENLGQIFNPFFTTKEVGQGIGLGLSICHSIVTEHGGNIYVESEPGKGATFIVELPITKD